MTVSSRVIHLLIVEDDIEVAGAIAALAFDVLSRDFHLVVGMARTSASARDLVQRVVLGPRDRLLVACAGRLREGGSGLAILDEVERLQPHARVVLLTDGDRDDLLAAMSRPVHGILQKPIVLPALRGILAHLASDDARLGRWTARTMASAPSEVSGALVALAEAVEAVETAHDRLRRHTHLASPMLQARLVEAERHAVLAHRRLLDVERGIRNEATASRMPSAPVQKRPEPSSADRTA